MPLKQRRVSWDFCFCMRCEMPGKCDRFEEAVMIKHTHGEKRHTIRGMGLREGNKNHANAAFCEKVVPL